MTLSAALIAISAVLLASSFKAAPSASGLSAAIAPALEGGTNPAIGSWTVTGSLNTARGDYSTALLPNGKVLVAGGGNSSGYLSSAELYETQSGMCSVCHKHTLTLSLACGSVEYQRHLDHGDTIGACQSAAAPLIISPLSIFGNINRQLVYQIVATGNPQSYAAANLPAGLALDPVLGIISGIPVVSGTTAVTITAANSQGMDVRTLNLTPFDPSLFPNPPFIANVGSLTARTGQPFAFDVIARGLDSNHVVSTAGSAPGIMFRPLTSDLVGTPQEDGSFAINFIIHTPPPLDDLIYNIQTLQVTFVSDSAQPVITSAASVSLVPGEPFTYTITAPNSAAPKDQNHYSVIGTLPSGLVFDSNAGTISGTYPQGARQILNAPVGPVGSFVDIVTLVAQNSHGVATLPLTFLLP